MTTFFGRKSKLMMTSALVAAGTIMLSSSAMAGPWDDVSGVGFTNTSGGINTTNIAATTANGKASGTGNLDILAGQTVNIDAKLFVAHDNRPTITTQILGNLNSNGTVVLIDRNGIIFGKNSIVDVGSLIASTGDINASALADADTALLFSNYGAGEIVNEGSVTASGLVAFVAPTVKNSGTINAKLGAVALAAGNTAATVDLYGDGLVEFTTSPIVSINDKFLAENTGNITGGKIQMTAAAAKSVADSVVNMQGVLMANSAVVTAKGDIILSAGTVKLGSASVKSPSIKGNTNIKATQLELGLTVDGDVSGTAKKVDVLSTKAKIAQGLQVVSAGGTVNVAAGTYNEHLVIDKAGVTLNGANAGVAGNGVRGAETVINPKSPGVTITADNVTVDGLLFSGAAGADGYGIFVDGGDNATLKNNIINNNSQNGIFLSNSLGSVINGNLINNTGSHGIYALNSANAQILNNNIGTIGTNNNIKGDGILVESSNGTVVKGNTITETTSTATEIGSGVHIKNSDNVIVGGILSSDKNTISQSEWDNVKVTSGNNVLVEGNDLDTATRVGVYALGTNNMIARNNDIDGAKMYGVKYLGVTGSSSILGNTIDTIGIDGINVYYSNGVTVANNTIGYGNDGVLNTADDTVIANDGASIVYSSSTQASGNKVAHSKRNGFYIEGAANNVLNGNTVNFTGKSGLYLLNTTGAQILNNNIGTVAINNNINGDGVLVEKSNGTVLKGNKITETTSTAIEVGSGIHVLNSNNVIIGGALASDRNTISQSEWDNVKVTNGNNILVENNDLDTANRVGVYALGTSNIIARNNDIDGAKMYGVKYLSVTGASSILGNTIDTIGIDGVNVYYSNGITVANNKIGYGNDGVLNTADDTVISNDGISLLFANNTQVSGNTVAHTKRNGIYIEGAAGNVLTGNTVNFTGKSGMYLLNTTGAQILNNNIGTIALNNNIKGDGILAEKSNGTVIKGNTITETTSTAAKIGSGIHILNSDNVIIGGALSTDKNTISQSEWDNIKVTAGKNILVEGNDLDTAIRVGVYAEGTDGIIARNNDIDTANMYGVKYMSVTGASSVVGNTIDKIGIDGILIYYSSDVGVSGNVVGYGTDGILGTADDSVIKGEGLSVTYSKGTIATSNKIAHAARNGIYVLGESGTTLTGNSVDFSGIDGIQIFGNKNTLVQNNLIGYGVDGVLSADDTTTIRDGIHIEKSSGITASGNQIVNAGANGVQILNASGLINISANDIDNSVANGILATGTGAVNLNLSNNNIFNTGRALAAGTSAINLDVSGTGTVQLAGNTMGDNFDYGLNVTSGVVDLTGATNTIRNTNIGMRFYPTLGSSFNLVGATIGTTAFLDQAQYYVDLGFDAMFAPGSPTIINGSNATYTQAGVMIDPTTFGGMTQAEYDYMQTMLNDYNDFADRGLFFLNLFPPATPLSAVIDQKDILRFFGAQVPQSGSGSLRITGLPRIALGGAATAGATPTPTTLAANGFNPNAIEPAAGGDSNAQTASNDVAGIEPAAGGNESPSACWADATASLGQGTAVTFNFGAGQSALLQNAVTCGAGGQPQGI